MIGYIGPGAGLTAFGALIAVIAAAFLLLIGFVWYPLRRLRRAMKQKKQGLSDQGDARSASQTEAPDDDGMV